MASLLERMNKNKQTIKEGSGPLTETSNEEVQGLAQKAGMPSTPSNPFSASGIDANADQAKMMGTPAAQMGAQRMEIQQQDSLSTQNRQAQSRKQSTAAEQDEQVKALQFDGLGSLGDRVQQIATGMLNQTATGANAITSAMQADDAKVEAYIKPGADKAQTSQLLNKLGDGSVTDAEMVQLATNLGFTDVSNLGQLKESIKSQFMTAGEQLGAFTSGRIADNLFVNQLTGPQLQDIGFSSISDFAAALGVPEATLSGMSIRQLQDQFGKKRLEDFGKTQRAQAVIADPTASRAEKEQALLELKELGATGVRSAESDVKAIEKQVIDASTVKFGGQDYTVEDLLKDDTIKGIVKTYLTDPEEAKNLADKEPAFAEWIEKNKKVLAAASSDVDARQESFAKVQLDNMKVGETEQGNLSADTMKSIYPDFGKLTSQKYEEPAFLKMIKNGDLPSDTASNLISTANELANIDPKYVQDLAGISSDELNALGLNNSKNIDKYRQYVAEANQLLKAPEEEIISRITGEQADATSLGDLIDTNRALQGFGLGGTDSPDYHLFDFNKDGQLDSPDQIRQNYLALRGGQGDLGALTVKEMLARGVNAPGLTSGSQSTASLRSTIAAQAQSSDLFQKYGQYWKGDGQLTAAEAGQLVQNSGEVNFSDLEKLANTASMPLESKMSLLNGLNSKAYDMVNQRVSQTYPGGTQAAIAKASAIGDSDNGIPASQQELTAMDTSYRTLTENMLKPGSSPIVKKAAAEAASKMAYALNLNSFSKGISFMNSKEGVPLAVKFNGQVIPGGRVLQLAQKGNYRSLMSYFKDVPMPYKMYNPDGSAYTPSQNSYSSSGIGSFA